MNPYYTQTFQIFLFSILLVSVSSCQYNSEIDASSPIIESIESLLERPGMDAHVIFESEPTRYIVQFFSDGDVIYFELPIQSLRVKGSPIIQEVGDFEKESPDLSGDIIEEMYIDTEQLSSLQNLLNSYDLKFIIGFQTGYDSHNNKIIGSHEIIRGECTLELSETEEFLKDIFELAFALKSYDIKIYEN